MNIFQRLTSSLFGLGLKVTVARFCIILVDRWFDFRYGVDTCSFIELDKLTVVGNNKAKGVRYQPARILPVRRFFKTMRPILPDNSVIVDFGSGKGRILLIASEFGFQDARGVEFAHELCEVARKNCRRYKSATKVETQFRIIETDAVKYEIRPEENVFMFYNPFDDAILNAVLDNISASIDKQQRRVFIIYYHPKWARIIEDRNNFICLQKLNFWGYKFYVYSNRN